MNHLQRQPPAGVYKAPRDDTIEKGSHPLKPRLLPSELSLRTLYDEQEISTTRHHKKGVLPPTDKYAKYEDDPPDGGLKAWSVILATCLTTCAGLGFITSWGIFQSYYEEVMLPNESPSDIAWIGSVQDMESFLYYFYFDTRIFPHKLALMFFCGPVTGRLFDIGYLKIPHLLASCLLVLCTFLISECKVYWQFFLVQGLGIGLASGILFGPTLGIIPHWFSKRRGLAMGVSAIGSSIGGTTFPIAAQNLIPEVGFKWTMRIFGFIMVALFGVTNFTMDRRLPPVNTKGGLFNWAALRNPAYAVYCISGATAFLGMYTVLMYISISAIQVDVSSNFAFYLAAIANVSSVFGRIVAGFLGDLFGAMNVMIPFTVVVAASTALWPYMKTESMLIVVAVIYGFAYGTYISLVCVPVIAMGSTNDVGRRIGLFLAFLGIGALAGTPISGAINSATGGFVYVGWYAGDVLLLSAGLLLLARYLHLGKWVGKF